MRYKKLHFFHKKVGKKIWSIQKNVVSLYCEKVNINTKKDEKKNRYYKICTCR